MSDNDLQTLDKTDIMLVVIIMAGIGIVLLQEMIISFYMGA